MSDNSFFDNIEKIISAMQGRKLADQFRIISFTSFEEYPLHKHLRIEMNYVRKGGCIIQTDQENSYFREGELMIICSDIRHSFQAGHSGCTLLQLEFTPELFNNFTRSMTDERGLEWVPCDIFTTTDKLIKIVDNIPVMRAVQRIVNEMNTRNKYYQHLVVMYYAELMILIYRYMNESYIPMCNNADMTNAINYIRVNYMKDISVKQIADQTDVGERFLRKLFARHMNISPLGYLNQIRINKAIELLRVTEMSVKEVCFQCGFKSSQYFSKIFKQQVGVPPKELSKTKI